MAGLGVVFASRWALGAEAEVEADPATAFDRIRSAIGLAFIIGLAWLWSTDRRRVDWRLVGGGLALQFVLAVLVLSPPGQASFGAINDGVKGLLAFSNQGATFVFGRLADSYSLPVGGSVVPMPNPPTEAWVQAARRAPVAVDPNTSGFVEVGAWIAFNVLPTIIFFSSLMAVLYHVGVMPRLIRGIAWIMRRTLRTSGAETLSAAGNIFVGQTEAPLLIRPFLEDMTESELMTIMTAGFATVAGGVMVAYVQMLQDIFPDIAGHLLSASLMSAPAALVLAKIMVPEAERSEDSKDVTLEPASTDTNVIDAAARGAGEGLQLALNVGAMLIAFVALVALINGVLGWTGGFFGRPDLSLEWLLGAALGPFAYLLGVPWPDAMAVGSLLGIKTVVNEFVAYGTLSQLELASPRSTLIAVYALCGFANLGSIGIQLGGIGPLCPGRRPALARLAFRAMVAGNLAACMTAAVIGLLD
jgi:CNT family concentrative nucleoside transporter